MASIYNVGSWASGTVYQKNDIVSYPVTATSIHFFYCLKSNAGSPPAIGGTNYWDGVKFLNNKDSPFFLWVPSYGLSISHDPVVKIIKFGDGYEQRAPDGINNNRLKLDLSFEKRDTLEATAIIHFLSKREGSKAFSFSAPEPYSSSSFKLMVCRSWTSSFNFADNYNIKAVFEEVSN